MIRRVSFTLAHTLALSLVLCVLQSSALAQPNVQGQWTTRSNTMPINPIHVALMSNGKLLVVAGSGNCPPSLAGCPSGPPYGPWNGSGALLWDPVSEQVVSQFSLTWDMFCNAMVLLPDGRPFIAGGTLQSGLNNGYDPFLGSPQSATFDPATNTFSNTPNMAHGRWYPTLLTLGDGRVMASSGLMEDGNGSLAVEYYSASSGWSTEYSVPFYLDLYPRLHLLPNGMVFYSGSQTSSRLFDPSTNTWTGVAFTNYGNIRTYGTSVLLPLSPSNNYDPQVMIMGGGNPSTNTTEIIDMGAATPMWQYGPNMSQSRIEMNAVVLPNGKVLAVGGSLNDEDTSTASLNADLYDPVSNTFSSAGANAYPRLYHSVALLLPDATVWLAGGNPSRGSYEPHIEIYQPAYLFNGDGTMATRPSITSAPSSVGYGATFTVATPDAASISSAVLVRNGTVTHAFGMDQRVVGLPFTVGNGILNVTAPPDGNIAPPGFYMLFLLNQSGVPSVATFVQVSSAAADFSIGATPSSQTVSPGGSTSYTASVTPSNGFASNVSFSVSGLPSGTTASFSPTTVAGSGSSTMTVNASSSAPSGTYTLTISASGGGLTHTTQVTLVVAGFSVSATPSSQTVSPGTSTSYTVNVTPSNGFTSNVSFSVSGLPSGATASFSPTTVAGSGSSTMTVNTSSSTPSGTYTLTISASGGGLLQTTQVTLVVSGFSIAATPSSQTVSSGGSTSYTASVTPSGGFNGNVSFSVSGLPSGATAGFSPTSVAGSGSSTMTVNTSSSTPIGTYTLTTSATGGGLTRTTQVKLVVAGFSVSATPSSRTAPPGTSTNYTVRVTALNGFTGSVNFSVSGLPSGATASFSPTTVTGSGSSTMTVNTSSSTPIGTYTLTISATGSGLTHTSQVTLVVADFSISVSPSSQSVSTNSSTSYTVSVSALGSFTSTVTLRVSGLPAHVSGSFSPGTVPGSGTSTLTVSATTNLRSGTYTLKVTGSGGGVTHSANVTLLIPTSAASRASKARGH